MSNCFLNYIGLRGCSTEQPLSGLWINSLPGISLNRLTGITTSEKATYVTLWGDIQDRAFFKLRSDVKKAMSKRYKLATIKRNKFKTVTDAGTVSDTVGGLNIAMVGDSEAGAIHVGNITLYGLSGEAIIKVTDVDSGTVLDTITTSTDKTNYSNTFFSKEINITVEGTVNNTTITDASGCRVRCCEGCGVYVGSITDDGNTHGIDADVYFSCDYGALICEYREDFVSAYMYLIASEIMMETIATDRKNVWTTIDREQAEELKAHYDVQYEKEIKTISDGYMFDSYDCCIECVDMVKRNILLP